MTSNGTRGADFERATRDLLTAHGYTVIRSTASKSPLDLVAVAPDADAQRMRGLRPWRHTLAVQSKLDGRLDHIEWNRLCRLAECGGLIPVLAKREKAGRRYVVALYRLTGPRVPRSRTWPMERILTREDVA